MELIWNGKYSYENNFDEANSFGFILKVKYHNTSFEGIALDEEFTVLTGEHAVIKGFIDNEHISFVKKYPFKFEEQEDGSILIDREKKGHEVIYNGFLNKDIGVWEGEWEILQNEVQISMGKYEEFLITGFWQMKIE